MKKLILSLLFCTPLLLQAQDVKRLNLEEAIAFAKQNAAELKNAELGIEYSKQEVKSVFSIGLPQVTASANFTHNVKIASQQFPDFISPAVYSVLINEGLLGPDRFRTGNSQTVQFGAPSSLTGMVNLNQLVFDGTYFLGLKAAKEYVEISNLSKNVTQQNLIESVHKSFYAALITDQNIKLAGQSLAQMNKTYTETEALFKSGFAEQLDIDRMLLSKTTMEQRLKNLKLQYEIMIQVLKITIGMPLNVSIVLDGNLEDYLAQNSLDKQASVRDRPEYKLLKQQMLLDSLNIKRYKVGYIPSVTMNASFQQNSFASEAEFKGLGNQWNPGTMYGFNLNIPIFDGFYKQAKISQAKIKFEQDQNTLSQTASNLLFEAEQAKLNVRIQSNNFETQQKTKVLAERIYKTILAKYNEGLATSFELIQAENDRVSAEIEYSNALYQLLLAQVQLNKTLGNLNK